MPDAIQMLSEIYRYVQFSDLKILQAAGTVNDEGFRHDHGFSHGSVHKMLVHAMGAQVIWLGRWKGEDRPFLKPEQFPTLESLNAHWPSVHAGLFDFLSHQTEQSLAGTIAYKRFRKSHTGVLWHLMQHVADHATYHHAHLNSMIKLSGGRPCDPSFISFSREITGQERL